MDRILQKLISMLKLIFEKYGIILIVILAFLLRVFWIHFSPPALNWDETALGYNAYSILKTGKDEWGNFLPLSLRSFDDYKPAVYSYFLIPFIYLLGLNEISVRIPSVIAGTVSVLLVYLIAQSLFSNKKISLISGIVTAIEPWAIHFSRAAFEANLALAFYLAGILFLIKSRLKDRIQYLGIFFLCLSAYTYHAEKILIIPTILVFLFVFRTNYKKVILTTILFLIPLIVYQFLNPATFSRLESTFLFKYPLERYLSYFSPINLFVRGTPEPTQHILGFGMFYVVEFFFWIIGLYFIIKELFEKKDNWKNKILVFLMLISPVPAIITFNWFYPARVLPLFTIYSIVIAIGISKIKLKPMVWIIISIFWLSLLMRLGANMILGMSFSERGNWQYGMKQMVTQIKSVEGNYDQVVIETRTAQPYIFLLFHTNYPPNRYHSEIENIKNIKPRKTFDFGIYKFRDVYWDIDKDLTKTLLVASESSLPTEKIKQNKNVDYVFDIKDPEGNLIYRLVGLK